MIWVKLAGGGYRQLSLYQDLKVVTDGTLWYVTDGAYANGVGQTYADEATAQAALDALIDRSGTLVSS